MMDAQPNPEVWPQCSDCHTVYVLRHCIRFATTGIRSDWLWQQDCQHGRKGSPQPPAVIANTDGPIDEQAAS